MNNPTAFRDIINNEIITRLDIFSVGALALASRALLQTVRLVLSTHDWSLSRSKIKLKSSSIIKDSKLFEKLGRLLQMQFNAAMCMFIRECDKCFSTRSLPVILKGLGSSTLASKEERALASGAEVSKNDKHLFDHMMNLYCDIKYNKQFIAKFIVMTSENFIKYKLCDATAEVRYDVISRLFHAPDTNLNFLTEIISDNTWGFYTYMLKPIIAEMMPLPSSFITPLPTQYANCDHSATSERCRCDHGATSEKCKLIATRLSYIINNIRYDTYGLADIKFTVFIELFKRLNDEEINFKFIDEFFSAISLCNKFVIGDETTNRISNDLPMWEASSKSAMLFNKLILSMNRPPPLAALILVKKYFSGDLCKKMIYFIKYANVAPYGTIIPK